MADDAVLWSLVYPRAGRAPKRIPVASEAEGHRKLSATARALGVTVEPWTGSAFDHWEYLNADVPD